MLNETSLAEYERHSKEWSDSWPASRPSRGLPTWWHCIKQCIMNMFMWASNKYCDQNKRSISWIVHLTCRRCWGWICWWFYNDALKQFGESRLDSRNIEWRCMAHPLNIIPYLTATPSVWLLALVWDPLWNSFGETSLESRNSETWDDTSIQNTIPYRRVQV